MELTFLPGDTPVQVLAPGNGKTKTGRLWIYVRDERATSGSTAPAVWFAYSPDRKGEHPRLHLKNFKGALQANAYAGFHHHYEGGAIYEVACWAHARRKFHDIPMRSMHRPSLPKLRASRSASRRSVFTRSPAFIGTGVGAITSHSTPNSANCQ